MLKIMCALYSPLLLHSAFYSMIKKLEDSRTPHKPVVSNPSDANIWLRSYDPLTSLTDVGEQRGGCQLLSQRREALSGLIQVNADEERKGGQAGKVYGCQL